MNDSWTQTSPPRDRGANPTRLPQRIGVTASGDCYHEPGCNHLRGRKARVYRPCLDCLDLPPDLPRGASPSRRDPGSQDRGKPQGLGRELFQPNASSLRTAHATRGPGLYPGHFCGSDLGGSGFCDATAKSSGWHTFREEENGRLRLSTSSWPDWRRPPRSRTSHNGGGGSSFVPGEAHPRGGELPPTLPRRKTSLCST